MDKLKMQSPNLVDNNIDKVAEIFPNCIAEDRDEKGNVRQSVDLDLLRQELSNNVVEGVQERYTLNWPGKNEAILVANAPIAKTLRPCEEESVDFDTTQNLFIEGDNLDVLKLLQETYLNKVKMIYIDPPYNTGNDILYKNDFSCSGNDYLTHSGQKTDNGMVAITNTETNGRFHSDWLSMMYSRIRLARNFLKDDGIFVVTIDHYEIYNLGNICDEVFGHENRLGLITIYINPKGRNQEKFFSPCTEYMLVYAKNIRSANFNEVVIDEEKLSEFSKSDTIGNFRYDNFMRARTSSSRQVKPAFWYPIFVSKDFSKLTTKETEGYYKVYPIKNDKEYTWKTIPETFEVRNNNSYFKAELVNDEIVIYNKYYENQIFKNIWTNKKYFPEFNGTQIIKKLFDGKNYFSFPKSVYAVKDILKIITKNDDIIMDFFAGSGTTAHALLELNLEDNGNRRFIAVQMDAECDENTEAFKDGYKTISKISKERIRRAGKKIKEENPLTTQNLDIGFRAFKVDSSNMKDVYYTPEEVKQDQLELSTNNIKEDRSPEDLLFQVFLDWGLELILPVVKETIEGKTVFFVDGNVMAACFDTGIKEKLFKVLAKRKPLRVVFRDDSYGSDSLKINVEQIFKLISPATEIKSI
jgi:adenine-specific DNA-methyltransferase